MDGALIHIDQNYSEKTKPQYSEIFYAQSVNGIIKENYQKEAVKAVYILYIYWLVFAGAGAGTITFKDQYKGVLFNVDNTATTNWAPVYQVRKGANLGITAVAPFGALTFSVSYQKIK